MADEKKLENEVLTEASGGREERLGYMFLPGARRGTPCKYCGKRDTLVCDRVGDGWENGEKILCSIFVCENCGGENYFSVEDDHLLK